MMKELETMKKTTKKPVKKTAKKVTPKKSPAEAKIERLKKKIKDLNAQISSLEEKLEKSNAKVKRLTDMYEPVSYLECYQRVCDYMSSHGGFSPDPTLGEDDEVSICLDYDGNEHRYWSSPRAFVGGDEDKESVFETVYRLNDVYDDLGRWDAEFAKYSEDLANVDVKDRTPMGIMKALDEAGL